MSEFKLALVAIAASLFVCVYVLALVVGVDKHRSGDRP